MSPSFPFLFGCALTGLLLGGACAWFLPGGESSHAVTDSISRSRSAAVPGAGLPDKPALTNRRARLLSLMQASAHGGGPSMAQAWRDAAGDPAMRAWLAELWMGEDPAAFIRMLCSSDEGFAMNMMLANLFTRFAEKDPPTAMRIGPTLHPPAAGRWIMSQAIVKIMESDAAEGLALAAKHPELRLNGNMDVDKTKVTAADLPLLMAMPRSGLVNDLIAKAMNGLPVAEAMKMTSQLNFGSRMSVLGELSQRWVNEDPAAAQDFALNEATDQQRTIILASLGISKIRDNPTEAAAWAERNLTGQARNEVLERAAQELEKTDPSAAETIRARLPQHYNPKPQ